MAREEAEIKELSDKLSKNPESLVFAPLADAHRRLKRYEEAIEICRKGLDVHPHYMTARVVLGRAYLESEMLDEAQEEFRTVVHADANHAMAHSMLGQIYSRKGMFPQAIQEHQLVLSINPDDTATQALLQEALDWARQPGRQQSPAAAAPPPPPPAPTPVVKKVDPPAPPPPPQAPAPVVDSQATLKVAEIYIKKGNLDEALEVFQDLLASDPGNQVALAKLKEIKALKEARDRKPEKPQPASLSGMLSGSDQSDEKITTDDIFSALDFKPAKKEAPAAPPPPPPAAAAPPPPPAPTKPAPAPVASAPMAPAAAPTASAAGIGNLLAEFNQTNGIEGSLYLDREGKVMVGQLTGVNDLAALGAAASSIFLTTEKAVSRMRQGKLNQIMIAGEDGRQILFAPLKVGVLAAVASKNANLGMLRIALHDLARKAS